ncbi:MAG: AMP-binding protein [Proteobacteria bacterium]|nr:MAG: AMP-binding protein [Pseudomonadota bacterium]
MAQAKSWEALSAGFEWQVPTDFNIGWDCCGRHALSDANQPALWFEDESGATASYTFGALQQAANRLSNALANLGVACGGRVAIILPQRPETAIAHIAVYQMGAIAVPLSHLFGPDGLEYRLGDATARAAIVDAETLLKLSSVRERLPELRHLVCVDAAQGDSVSSWSHLLAAATDTFEPIGTKADDPAMIIYTSGTTGSPKGALIPHRALLGNLSGFICSHDFFPQPGDMFWSPADWAWTGGLFDALLPTLHFGMPILAFRGRFEPERAFRLMEKYGVRNAFLFPTALKMMMKEVHDPKRYGVRLRSLMSGGEAVGPAVMEWAHETLGVTINEIFGQTEMNYVIGGCAALFDPKPGAMGRPYPGHRIGLLDRHGALVPDGETGEIAVWRTGDPVVFLEYWNNPQATRAKFEGDWGRTGDMASRDVDGYYWYKGRTDDVINSAGYRIGPTEIEDCLLKHRAVANAAVIGVPDHERGEIIKACVVLTAGTTGSESLKEEIQAHVRQRLAAYQCPRVIEFVEALPLTTTGKVQRRVLREKHVAAALDPARAPSSGGDGYRI